MKKHYRKLISLSILLSFAVLMTTGILEYLWSHTDLVSTLHTIFGFVFSIGVVLHFANNFKPVKQYLKSWVPLVVVIVVVGLMSMAYFEMAPATALMDFGTKLRAQQEQEVDLAEYELLEMNTGNGTDLTIDLVRGEHYWHPQMAVWTEDLEGNFLETVFISKATAQGLFFGGRSKENFKTFDENKDAEGDYRRVDALPVWSHKRNVQYADGGYTPPSNDPMPDAITGATLSENFILKTSAETDSTFVLRVEINVAFDDNEYYSEYDFPDDEEYHAGTGQLGQPSIIFESEINMNDGQDYYLAELVGHGHHSAQDGELNPDISTLTTALEIVKRIVIGVNSDR